MRDLERFVSFFKYVIFLQRAFGGSSTLAWLLPQPLFPCRKAGVDDLVRVFGLVLLLPW